MGAGAAGEYAGGQAGGQAGTHTRFVRHRQPASAMVGEIRTDDKPSARTAGKIADLFMAALG